MKLEQFEEYMNEVEDYAARQVNGLNRPFLCHCFVLTPSEIYPQISGNQTILNALFFWFRPMNYRLAWMSEDGETYSEGVDNRMTALFLFEEICISEKLYKEF